LRVGTVVVCPTIGGRIFGVLRNVALANSGNAISTEIYDLDMREAVETWQMTIAKILSALISCGDQENKGPNGWVNL
jgi:hypothetical protein